MTEEPEESLDPELEGVVEWVEEGSNPDDSVPIDAEVHLLNVDEAPTQEAITWVFQHDFIGRLPQSCSPKQTHMSRYDDFTQSQMKDSLMFDEEYRVALPWKYGHEETAKIFSETDFLSTARNRLRKLKAKLLRNPAQREFAFATMNDTLENNHAQVLLVPYEPRVLSAHSHGAATP